MMTLKKTIRTVLPAAIICLAPAAQSQPVGEPQVVFRVDVVSRTTKAINFHHRQGSTTVGLAGTSLAPRAKGEVKVDSKTGATKIDAYIDKMPPANLLDEGYLTYVMWAITPEGRPENIGELMLDGDHARLQAATELQSFGIIVTAEPYFAVTQPSDYVVMEGVVKPGTTGTIMPIETKFELVKRGGYLQNLPPGDRVRLREAKHMTVDLMEARQAVAVARSAGAAQFAADTLAKAELDLRNAEGMMMANYDKKKVQTLARHVTQLSEDARLISVRKANDLALQREREASAQRASDLERNAQAEAERRRNAEREAEQRNREAQAAQQQASDARRNTELAQAQLALEAERSRLANAQAEARAREQAALAQRERDDAAARQRLLESEAANAKLQASQAQEVAQRAEAERLRMKQELVQQLNVVLATRETARGLIVNMSDVLFDTGRYTLKPGAREKLARISGIILAHPGLKIEVEGHTDNVGGMEYNQRLSEQRAESVRSFLVSNGVGSDAVTSRGFGLEKPVADNSNAAGRQANRRVELVVNGPMLSSRDSRSGGR